MASQSSRLNASYQALTLSTFSCDIARAVSRTKKRPPDFHWRALQAVASRGLRHVWLWLWKELTHWSWFLKNGCQPPFLHSSLVVGAIFTGWASDDVKLSVNVAAPDSVIVTFTADVPSSWKFPLVVWIVAVYGTPVKFALPV